MVGNEKANVGFLRGEEFLEGIFLQGGEEWILHIFVDSLYEKGEERHV